MLPKDPAKWRWHRLNRLQQKTKCSFIEEQPAKGHTALEER